MPHFNYSSVWHFCGAYSTEKIDTLNKRILRKSSRRILIPHVTLNLAKF